MSLHCMHCSQQACPSWRTLSRCLCLTVIAQLEAERDRDRHTLAKMDVVSSQLRQESERREKIQETMLAKWAELQEAWNQEMDQIKDETNTENEKTRKLSTEMDQVVKQMRLGIV